MVKRLRFKIILSIVMFFIVIGTFQKVDKDTSASVSSGSSGTDFAHQEFSILASTLPILELDQELSSIIGSEFEVYFTAFSEFFPIIFSIDFLIENETINVYTESADFFVNELRVINATAIQKVGEHQIVLKIKDTIGRETNITKVVQFDTVLPIFDNVIYSTNNLFMDETLVITWEVIDDSFERVEFFVEDLLWGSRIEDAGFVEIGSDAFRLPIGFLTYTFKVKIIAYDLAGNSIEYFEMVKFTGSLTFKVDFWEIMKYVYISIAVLVVVGIIVLFVTKNYMSNRSEFE